MRPLRSRSSTGRASSRPPGRSPWAGEAPRQCAWCHAGLPSGGAWPRDRVACPACGVCTTSPWPSDEVLAEAYGAWYRPAAGRFLPGGDRALRRSRALLARRLHRSCPPGTVLDVGAGDGTLVAAFGLLGRAAVGLEREPGAPGIRAVDIDEVDGNYASVIFWHSLEHLRSPREALRRARQLLAPGGLLCVAIPNAASIQARVFGDRWFAADVPRHLVHVPARALLDELSGEGLRIERVSYLRGGQVVFGWLHGFVGWLPTGPDLYAAIRAREAAATRLPFGQRLLTLAVAVPLLVPAALAATFEVALRRGGTIYVEARRV